MEPPPGFFEIRRGTVVVHRPPDAPQFPPTLPDQCSTDDRTRQAASSRCMAWRRSARPGCAPVWAPSCQTRVPFTSTWAMSAAGVAGCSKVARSITRSGANTHRSVGAGLDAAAVGQAEALCGKAGHAPDGFLQRKQPDLAAIVSEHARERAPQPRMRMQVV